MTTRDLLAFEREWMNRPQHDGAKMAAVYERFGVGMVRYYQALVSVINTREALAADPVTCRLLTERLRAHRRVRSA